MKFTQNHHLKRHISTAHDEQMKRSKNVKEFKCNLCEKLYTDERGLQIHVLLIHLEQGKPEKFKCEICDQSFSSSRYLKSHVKTNH